MPYSQLMLRDTNLHEENEMTLIRDTDLYFGQRVPWMTTGLHNR
jgi:hypothetical protein